MGGSSNEDWEEGKPSVRRLAAWSGAVFETMFRLLDLTQVLLKIF